MTPSPLTKAERAEIQAMMELIALTRNGSRLEALIERLLEAEAFWREAVRGAAEMPSDECAYPNCNASYNQAEHKPDCPWLLAQAGVGFKGEWEC